MGSDNPDSIPTGGGSVGVGGSNHDLGNGAAGSPKTHTHSSSSPTGNVMPSLSKPDVVASDTLLPERRRISGVSALVSSVWRLLHKSRKPGALRDGDLVQKQLIDAEDGIIGRGASYHMMFGF